LIADLYSVPRVGFKDVSIHNIAIRSLARKLQKNART